MRLHSPFFLCFLVALPILWIFLKEKIQPATVYFSKKFPASLRKKFPQNWIRLWTLLALGLWIIALARPQNGFQSRTRNAEGVDILLSLDISASMNIEDLAERSRLDIAKETIDKFIQGRSNDRIGIVTFSGEAVTVTPPTLDYGLLLAQLKGVQSGVLRDGTAIGDGLSLAVQRLRKSNAKTRVIILLTDGESNIGQVDPLTAGDLALGYGIKVYTIAIGKEGRVRVPIKRQGMFGEITTTYQMLDNALNTELLEQIAAKTNAKFYRVTDEQTLKNVFSEIDKLERSPVAAPEKMRWEEAFMRFLMLSLGILLVQKLWSLLVWRVWA